MNAFWGVVLPPFAVVSLIVGFWRDPYAPFLAALKVFTELFIVAVIWGALVAGAVMR